MRTTIDLMPFARRRVLLTLSLLLIGAVLAGCSEDTAEQGARPDAKPAVTVAEAVSTQITPSKSFTGRAEAIDSVELRARVQGFLEQRLFKEGDDVKAGDVLFTIEKGPYEAQIGKIKGAIARLKGTLKLAEIERNRQEVLVKRNAVAQVRLDEAEARLAEVNGDLLTQNAALDRAELDLSYTDIKASVAGRIGFTRFSKGDFVGPASGSLATVVSQDPIYITFPVSQRDLLDFNKQSAGQADATNEIAIKLRLANGDIYDQVGKFDLVDVRAASGTDTVTVRGEIPNPKRVLFDRQLVGVIVETGAPEPKLVIPQSALQLDQVGAYVLVVDDDSKVQVRRIEMGDALDVGLVVTKGLEAKEKVITVGIQKVRPGMVVDATVIPSAGG